LGKTEISTKLADKILSNASKAAAAHIYVYSIFLTCKILSLDFVEELEQLLVNKSTFSALVSRSALEPNR
jgi:hypothetical protein